MKNVPTGISNFKTIIERNYLYIDKTLLIKDIIDDFDKPLCIIRPRRFCKSVNISMLDYYFNLEYKDNKLFKGLKIMEQGDIYFMEMNKYPVISISFKELRANTYQEFIIKFKLLMKNLYEKYSMLLDSDKIGETDKEFIKKINDMNEDVLLANSIAELLRMLKKYYDKEVIVLLDEYDVPVLNGYLNGYYDDILEFIKQVFSSTFKDNLDLKKGVVTGVLRIAIEELGTGANNFNTYDIYL